MVTPKKTNTDTSRKDQRSPEELFDLTIQCIEQLDYEQALQHAEALLLAIDPATASGKTKTPPAQTTPALKLLGEIHLELGDPDKARHYFLQSIACKPETQSEGISHDELAQVYFCLAQLSEEGGFDSAQWYERGVTLLKSALASSSQTTAQQSEVEAVLATQRREQIGSALCSVAELYMTDLSWEADAEDKCEALITEALIYAPEDPAVLQTLASIRLSQVKLEEAQSALRRSMALWVDEDDESGAVPEYPTRISLARLLMEAEMEDEAMIVLERLALEDDESVEACYLGGWCLHLMAEKKAAETDPQGNVQRSDNNEDDVESLKQATWKWLTNTIRLYEAQKYEDVNLRTHVEELLQAMKDDSSFTPATADADVFEEFADEEDDGSQDEDLEMADS